VTGVLVRGGQVVSVPGTPPRRVDVRVHGGGVVEVGPDLAPAGEAVVDAAGALVTPGLVDLQVNGAAGHDLTEEAVSLPDVSAALARHGVTTFLPTLVSCDGAAREAALAVPRRGLPGARAAGWHLEGPMLHPDARGAHDLRRLREPSPTLVAGWSPGAGVALVTLAPDLPGALPVVAGLVARGVVVAIGHTRATLAEVEAAVAAGASMVTHLFNATAPLHHRDPGPVGAALGGSILVAGVIVDGHHVHPLVVAAAWRALGPDRFLAVSDCTAALDLPPGPARLGGRDVVVGADHSVRVTSDRAVLAGSGAGLDECLWRLADVTGRAVWEVLPAATTVPARVLRRPHVASLTVGAAGDAVIWDGRRPAVTVVGGRPVGGERAAAR
jgi:N-acetylglucosamine-6-phosphate deacetylase